MHTLKDIEESVCLAFGVTSWDLHSASRKRKFARPRQTVFYLARELTGYSMLRVATAFGKDHATVLYGAAHVAELIIHHAGMAKRVERTREILATITPYRARLAELIAANPPAAAPERPPQPPRLAEGDRRRRVIDFARAHASSGARP